MALIVGIGFIILYPLLRQISFALMHPDDLYDLDRELDPPHT
jgi:hypothetical protein